MRQIGIVIAGVLALAGCDDTRSGEDAGGIRLPDSGMTTRDSGTTPTDSGTTPATCAVSSFMPLPAGCLPRCSSATLSAVNDCGSRPTPEEIGMCQNAALMADTTPAGSLMAGGMAIPLDCATCFGWQIQTCWADSCPAEFQAWGMCDPMSADCSSQEMALDSCLMANSMAIQNCAQPRATACFDTGGGFLPDLRPRELRVDTARLESFARRYGHTLLH